MKIKKICLICKREFLIHYYRKDIAKLCSNQCRGIWFSQQYGEKNSPHWNKVKLKCNFCQKEYWVCQSRKKKTKYCSRQCHNESIKGKKLPENHPFISYWKGKKRALRTEKHKKNLSLSLRKQFLSGRKVWNKNKINWKQRGKNHWNWQGGISSLRELIKSCVKYHKWQDSILKKYHYTCQKCGEKKRNILIIHHLKNFSQIIRENNIKSFEEALDCKELWDTNNGIVFCKKCHKEFHRIYKYKNNTKEQVEKFLINQNYETKNTILLVKKQLV